MAMRLLFYNILDGGADDPERLARLMAWIARCDAAVAGLAECNGWDHPGVMDERARACGFEHGCLLADGPSAYLPAVLSRQPIEQIEMVTRGVHHGVLHVRTAGLDVIVTHFSPTDAALRVREAESCAAMLARCDGPAILVGDLNSHSPVDAPMMEAWTTAENRAWAMDFRPHEVLRASGLIDLGQSQPARWSTATALKPDEPRRRLDFAYANRAFVDRWPASRARIVRDEETADLSDHYPLLVEIA